MINISGELYIGLPTRDSGMAELQDAITVNMTIKIIKIIQSLMYCHYTRNR